MVIHQTFSRSIGQVIRRNNAVSTRQLVVKLRETYNALISHPTVWKHIKKKIIRVLCPSEHQR